MGWGGNSLRAQQLWDEMAGWREKAASGQLDQNSGSFGHFPAAALAQDLSRSLSTGVLLETSVSLFVKWGNVPCSG